MRWASALSSASGLAEAVGEAARGIRAELGDAAPDLIFVFVGASHAPEYGRVPALIAAEFAGAAVIGCSGGGVIGAGREVEHAPGLSLTAAVLPGVDVVSFHLESGAASTLGDDRAAWRRQFGLAADAEPHIVLLPDPFSFDVGSCVEALDRVDPGGRVVGGLASGAQRAAGNALFHGANVHRTGAVGVALAGNVAVDTVVAQGCRPIGLPMFVTRCERNLLWALDGQPAVEVLGDLFGQLLPADQALVRQSLFLGIAMRERRSEYGPGDFLVRNVVGLDPERGIIGVGAQLRENTVVQFHLRDARTSALDLEQHLERYASEHREPPRGALLFSCLGRGIHLYGEAGHDSAAFLRRFGSVPLGGFFCNGEIGPVHGTTFLHGYTSSFGLFRPRAT